MDYPQDFPAESRARVEAARIRAGRKLDLAIKRLFGPSPGKVLRRIHPIELEGAFWKYALTPFLVFAEEAYRLRLWPANDLNSRCREALRHMTIEAYYHKGKGIVADPIGNLDGSIEWAAQQRIEKEPQWRKFENLLLKLAEEPPFVSFEIGIVERNRHLLSGELPQENQTGTAPIAESKPANLSSGNTREAFLRPILEKKGFSVRKWAREANVDFHTADKYMKGKTKPYRDTVKQLAEALGIEVDKLPK